MRLQPIRDALSGYDSAQAAYHAARHCRLATQRWAIGLRPGLAAGRATTTRTATRRTTTDRAATGQAPAGRGAAKRGRILAYHSIGTPQWGVNDVRPRDFERHLQVAIDDGWTFATPADVLADPDQPRLALTFDDGVTSVLTQALPVLRHHGIPATAFIVTGWADGRHRFGHDYVLDWRGVRTLRDAGITIASHSVTHPDFGQLTLDDAVRELEESQKRLRDMLDVDSDEFAIPLGQSRNWTSSAGLAAVEAGYRRVYAQAVNTRPAGTIERTFITRVDRPILFRAALSGAYDDWEE